MPIILTDLLPVDYAIVPVPDDLEIPVPSGAVLEFAQWRPSSYQGWLYRVDPSRPERNEMRHVHIAKEKHVSAKNRQASWNDDGSRHDRKTFDSKTGDLRVVKDIAREVLGLGPGIVLELVLNVSTPPFIVLGESIERPSAEHMVALRVRNSR